MKKLEWFAVCAFFLSAACCVSAATRTAAGANTDAAFNGTWKIDAAHSKLSPKPISFYIANGWYHCNSCDPQVVVEADGADHTVTGQAYDSLAVKVVNDDTIQETAKSNGKVIYEETDTVSKDGKLLKVKITSHPKDGGAAVTTEGTAKRVGVAPRDVQATSGDWQVVNFNQSSNGLTFTYKVNGDEVTMTDPTGESYTAKLDGSDAPVKGAYGYDSVSLKKIAPDTIEETDKRDGKVVDVTKMTVHGNTMTIEDTSKPTNRTSTFIAHKAG